MGTMVLNERRQQAMKMGAEQDKVPRDDQLARMLHESIAKGRVKSKED